METTGTYRSYDAVQGILSFDVGKLSSEQIQTILGANTGDTTALPLLDIKAVVHRKKRSLDANAMHWACCNEIAAALHTTKEEVHKELILKYGAYSYTDGQIDYVIYPPSYEPKVDEYLQFHKDIHVQDKNGNPITMKLYLKLKESHLMNTKEFSRLLDGTVDEMKEIGLETPVSGDMKRALERWEG